MLCFYISINVGPFNNNGIMTKVTLNRGVGPMLNAFLMSIFMLNSNFNRKLRQKSVLLQMALCHNFFMHVYITCR